MTRAAGRHAPPRQATDDDRIDPEGRQLGASARMQGFPSPIPGGKTHIVNAPAVRQETPVADARPEIHDMNAHGVKPGTGTTHERAEAMRGPNDVRGPDAPAHPRGGRKDGVARPEPVPVYIINEDSQPRMVRRLATRKVTLNAAGGEAILLCGADRTRVKLGVINESTSSDARIAAEQAELTVAGHGAILPWPMNTYLQLDTQDELWAISNDSGTPTISVIQVFEQPW